MHESADMGDGRRNSVSQVIRSRGWIQGAVGAFAKLQRHPDAEAKQLGRYRSGDCPVLSGYGDWFIPGLQKISFHKFKSRRSAVKKGTI